MFRMLKIDLKIYQKQYVIKRFTFDVIIKCRASTKNKANL